MKICYSLECGPSPFQYHHLQWFGHVQHRKMPLIGSNRPEGDERSLYYSQDDAQISADSLWYQAW